MKNISRFIAVFVVIILPILFSGCQSGAAPSTIPSPDLALKVTGTVTASSSAVVGTVKNIKGEPLVDVSVKLATVVWNEDKTDGAYFLEPERGPTTGTNPDGTFTIVDITPKDYVMVIGDPFGANTVVKQANSEKPVIYTLEAGKVLDVGELKVDLIP